MNKLLLKLAIRATVGSLLSSNPTFSPLRRNPIPRPLPEPFSRKTSISNKERYSSSTSMLSGSCPATLF